jgi:exopolysaccharide biosynthesis polyprenyl glycosylphosphotransferase
MKGSAASATTKSAAPNRRTRAEVADVADLGFGTRVPRSFLLVIDVLSIAGAFFATYTIAPHVQALALGGRGPIHDWILSLSTEFVGEFRPLSELAWTLAMMSVVVVFVFEASGAYRPLIEQTRTQMVVTSVAAALMGLGAIALVPFSLRSAQWSRVFIFTFTALTVVWVTTYRLVLRWYQKRRIASGVYARHLVLAGSPAAVAWLADYLRTTTSPTHYQLRGWMKVDPAAASGVEANSALPALGVVDDLGELLVHQPIHEVIAIQGDRAGEWLRSLVETCDYFRVTLRLVPEALIFGDLKDLHYMYHADPLRLPEIVLRPRDFDSDALFLKRLMDVVVSATLLLLLAPLFALIALGIKLTTPHLPVFYPWEVVGFKGRRFTGYKFSTMVENADARREALLDRNEMQGPVFKIKNDPRVTPLGRYLRKFSLNELPQLWSVLKGDMSLVGPRPAFPHELERYELWHKRKLCVRPGMTCLWQVRGRNRISQFDDWVRMDLEYIDQWSLWLDVKILVRTVWAVVAGTGS